MNDVVTPAKRRWSMSGLCAVAGLAVGSLAIAATAAGCRSESEQGSSSQKSPSTAPPAPSGPPSGTSPEVAKPSLEEAAPKTLLELNESAYRGALRFDGDTLYMLTETAAYRIAPGKAPERMALELGAGPALTSTSIVYWSKGAVFSALKAGGEPRKLAKVARQPQVFVASEDRFAWLDRDDSGKYTIQTLRGEKPKVAYTATGSIAAVTMYEGTAFFAEVASDSSWRIGAVSLDGGDAVYTQPHTGRSPSMLVAHGDVFFYDGPRRSVIRLSPDLSHEEVMADKLICSPIAVSSHVICAQVGAIYEIPLDSHAAPRRLIANPGFVAVLAASDNRVVWLTDRGKSGEDKLALLELALAPQEAAKKP